MKTATLLSFALLSSAFLFLACGPSQDTNCVCIVATPTGDTPLACGQLWCSATGSFQCTASRQVVDGSAFCGTSITNGCTPKTCAQAGATCGEVSDGCGRTVMCGACAAGLTCGADNTCKSACDGVTCGPGQRCDPGNGACVEDACTRAKAVCGTVDGQVCGTCPGATTCSTTQRACLETVATLPFSSYVSGAALSGDALYVSGPPSSSASSRSLVELNLASRQVRTLGTGLTYLSPLAVNGTHLFYATGTGVSRIPHGGTTAEALTGLNGSCSSLLATATEVLCGFGGDAKYGVGYFGVKSMPVAGGTSRWRVQSLNYPRLALAGTLLFHLGTTDNSYSFKVLGVTDLADGFEQTLVTGGILDSSFLMTDASAYYMARHESGRSVLMRTGFNDAASTDVLTSTGFLKTRTVSTNTELFTVATVNGVKGLYRVPAPGGAATLMLNDADLQGADTVDYLLRTGDGFVFIAGTKVVRVRQP